MVPGYQSLHQIETIETAAVFIALAQRNPEVNQGNRRMVSYGNKCRESN